MRFFRRNKEKKIQKQAHFNELKKQLADEFNPIIEKADNKLLQPAKNWIQKNQLFTFILMITIIVINVVLINIYQKKEEKKSDGYSELISQAVKSTVQSNQGSTGGTIFSAPGQIILSINEIKRIEELKDSMSLLMLKKSLTREDSLAFIRLSEEVEKIQNKQ